MGGFDPPDVGSIPASPICHGQKKKKEGSWNGIVKEKLENLVLQ